MSLQHNVSLKKYNTFGIDVKAKEFVEITSKQELISKLQEKKNYFILGGGSNMLLTKNIKDTILHINIKGIQINKETTDATFVEVNAGENWHEFVLWTLQNNLGGIENLSLIPGNVGTCPIQNIGAYGVEVKDTIFQVNTIAVESKKTISFSNSACDFGYRSSIFKNEEKGHYIITSVVFKLTNKNHTLNYKYGAIQQQLNNNEINTPTIQNISEAIIHIRNKKLPNPKEIGNSGSFFKNPVVEQEVFLKIQKNNPEIPFYLVGNKYKIPAGWLIEQSGFKGKRFGDTGVHKNQALVLVNYGNATGKEILTLAKKIQNKVRKLFFISLEMEVNIF